MACSFIGIDCELNTNQYSGIVKQPCEQNIWSLSDHDIWFTYCVQSIDDLINYWQNSLNI